MKWTFLLLFITSRLWAMTPILNDYKDPQDTFTEFRNVFDNGQNKINVVTSTPNAIDMNETDLWVYQSSVNAKDVFLFLRIGTTVYGSINFPIIKGR